MSDNFAMSDKCAGVFVPPIVVPALPGVLLLALVVIQRMGPG